MARRHRAALAALLASTIAAAVLPWRVVAASAVSSTPVARTHINSLTVTFDAPTTIGRADSIDGSVRTIALPLGTDAAAALARWEREPGVLAVLPDVPVTTTLVPSDPLYGTQWDMGSPLPATSNGGAANVAPVWSTATGAGAVVAVVDTGGLPHPDLIAAQPNGWGIDMVSEPSRALDGDGRDLDPTDTGDDCGWGSSWHGTHVAGTIAAQHNEIGVAGIAPDAQIMHVRVLGRCGGSFDDVIDGIRWAAGLPTTYWGATWESQGLPTNTHPADVINLSLGGGAPCFTTLQTAIDEARAAGTLVVAAAGNNNIDAANFAPANCDHVITVASVGQAGGRAYYSNFGSTVEIAAPGGDMSRDGGILSTIGIGRTTISGYGYTNYQGTSMAAPHVVGVAALLFGAYPGASPASVESMLISSARPFSADAIRPCVARDAAPVGAERRCGVGLLDAASALGYHVPVIELGAPLEIEVDQTAEVSITSDDSAAVSLVVESGSSAVCSLDGVMVTALTIGDCSIVATAPAHDTVAAGYGRVVIPVRGLAQTINDGPITLLSATPIEFGTNPDLNATATSGLPVSFSSTPGSWCGVFYDLHSVIPQARLGYDRVGECTIMATQPGNTRYRAATPVALTFTIVPTTQLINSGGLFDRTVDAEASRLDALSSRGLPISWSSQTPTICAVDLVGGDSLLRTVSAGRCTVTGEQGGASWVAPASLTRTILISKRQQAPLVFNVPRRVFEVGEKTSWGWGGGSTSAAMTVRTTTPRVCRVQSGSISFIGQGTCTLVGRKEGSAVYSPAEITVQRTVFIRAKAITPPRLSLVNGKITGSLGEWSLGAPRATLDYAWWRCTSPSGGCSQLPSSSGTTIPVISSMRGWYIMLRVRATHFSQAWTETESWSNPLYITPR